jgi:hypothetical protein
MDLLRQIDGYCERLGPGYWAEPVNAVTNLGFVLVAVWLWRRSAAVPMARVLAVILACIGLGSYLFHTHAQVWAAIADTAPIGLFILLYLYAVNREVWGMPVWAAAIGTALFIPYALATVPLWQTLCAGDSALVAKCAGLGCVCGLCARARPDRDLCAVFVATRAPSGARIFDRRRDPVSVSDSSGA